MTKIYLIRHAEAEGNYFRRIQGHYNGGITVRGRQQIEALAERFKDTEIHALYSSDLKRTVLTAGAILKYHPLDLVTEPRLREVDMGSWEDLPWGNAAWDQPDQMYNFSSDPDNWYIPGREAYSHLQDRIYTIVKELAAKHDGQTIALVSHGLAIRSLVCKLKNIPAAEISRIPHGDNTCVACLYLNGDDLELEYFNDNSHLGDELSTFARQDWWKKESRMDYSNLRIVPMDLEEDAELYKSCYADAWQCAHGSTRGFQENIYLQAAKKVSGEDPNTLMKAFYGGDSFAGIVELDPHRGADEGAGWISLCYLIPEMRDRDFGAQLLGHAVSFFRKKGRKTLRLNVAETNSRAIRFYEKNEFTVINKVPGVASDLLVMEAVIK